jgi:hypothetical protein
MTPNPVIGNLLHAIGGFYSRLKKISIQPVTSGTKLALCTTGTRNCA